jgi:dephospho-CoA kinase
MNIGLIGKAGTGKDTFATFLCEINSKFKCVALADPLKEIAHTIFNIPKNQLWCPSQNKTEYSRRIMQLIGQKMREIDSNIWVSLCVQTLQKYNNQNIPCIVTDIRFPNELEYLRRNANLISIKLIKTNTTISQESAADISETSVDLIDNADYIISNNGTLLDLCAAAKSWIMTHYAI